MGPTCIGQFCYGVKTGVGMIQDSNGRFKMLAFTGESRPDTREHLLCAAADVEVAKPARLNRLILEHGFAHHLALAIGDIRQELRLLCDSTGLNILTLMRCDLDHRQGTAKKGDSHDAKRSSPLYPSWRAGRPRAL